MLELAWKNRLLIWVTLFGIFFFLLREELKSLSVLTDITPQRLSTENPDQSFKRIWTQTGFKHWLNSCRGLKDTLDGNEFSLVDTMRSSLVSNVKTGKVKMRTILRTRKTCQNIDQETRSRADLWTIKLLLDSHASAGKTVRTEQSHGLLRVLAY